MNTQCEQLQEEFDVNKQCEQLQKGFDVNKQCEQLQEGFDVNKHCEQLKFPGSKISKRQKRKLKQKEQRSKRKKEKNEVATEADINDSCHREQIYLNYFDASGSPSCKRQKLEITNEEYEPSCSVAISQSSIGRMPPWKPQQFSSSRPQPPFGVMTSRSPSKTFQLSDMLEFHPSETSQQFFPIRPRPSFDTMTHSTQLNTSKLCQQRHRERTNKRLSKKNQRKLRLQHRNEMRDKQNKEGGTQSISMEEISLSVCESNPENNTLQKASSFQNQYFPRKSILCSRGLVEQIPKSYILNRLSRDEHGAKELSQEIFKDVSGLTDLYQTRVLPALEKMLNSHKKCSYHQLLNQCFSGEYQQSSTGRREIIVAREKIRKSTYGNVGNQGHVRVKPGTRWTKRSQKVSTKTLLSRHLQTSQIFMFLRRVLTRVIPDELLGKSNKNKLCKYIKPFLNLRKYDKFSLAELKVDQMKLEDIPWLAAVALRADQLHLLSQVICWIFKDYVMVLLRSFLYITETAHHRNRLLYFRKRDWLRLHMRGLNTLLNKKMIEPITQTEAQKQLAEGSALGVASLRFLPKMKSLRPLVNLGRKPPPGCKQKIPMNRQMLHMLNILNYYKDKNPDLVGSAIFGLDKVYPMWKQFALQYRQQGHRRSGIAPLYFVKVDIATCFEDINPEKLFSILKDIFLKDEEDYHINKYVTMFVAGGQVKRTFRRKALPLSEFNPLFTNFVKETVERENLKNNIFVDQVVSQSENSQHLLKQLKSHLFNNLIKVGKKYYRQASGISQGSILSTMLCNLYYGHFEKKLFSLLEGEELRMRIVDDSLFVTPHKDRAIYFLNLMFKGMADYNLHVNPDKVLLNFPLEQNDIGSFPVIQTEWFPWCGMLFNTLTLQASMDFSRYAGISVADTMSFDLSEDLLMTLKQKLLHALNPFSHSINVDTLNTTEIVVTNIFKIFVLNALKFNSYHRRLPQNFTYNGEAFIDLLMGIGSYFYYQAHAFLTKKGSIPAVFSIPKDVVLWLGLHAFHVVLQQYKTEWQHKNFIMALTRQLRFIMARLEYQEEGLSAVLLRVCGNQVPDELMDLIP
ncbi:telomerase reverse transcriptase-like [Ylistrum balloti]|uniref:telomerase reverse transcriptase-like n=1 Tax=Ylistrum balloti TaxID=509963 RepID=UPI002905D386|nr:telomerase reverse transcriptase-like [Ylistrum balloti]